MFSRGRVKTIGCKVQLPFSCATSADMLQISCPLQRLGLRARGAFYRRLPLQASPNHHGAGVGSFELSFRYFPTNDQRRGRRSPSLLTGDGSQKHLFFAHADSGRSLENKPKATANWPAPSPSQGNGVPFCGVLCPSLIYGPCWALLFGDSGQKTQLPARCVYLEARLPQLC